MSPTSSVVKFAAAGLAAVILLGLLAAAVLRNHTRNEAIRQAKELTRLAGRGIVQPALRSGIYRGDPSSLQAVDRTIHRSILRDPVVRVKIWTAGGRILYSDEPRLLGNVYPLGREESEALREGKTSAEISNLAKPENRFDRKYHKLLEVYLPIRGPGGRPLLFESYSRFSSVAASSRRQWEAFAPALIGALVLLWLVQVPLASSLARRLRTRQREREDLLQRAIEAQDLERRRIAGALHDDVVQDLAGLGFSLSAAAGRADANGTASLLREAADQTRQTMRKLRSVLVDIYPPRLQRAGLQAAIDDLVAPLAAQGATVDVDIPARPSLPPGVEALIFRTVQEGLRNAAKHAHARNVNVSVRVGRDNAEATIADDGDGFEPETAIARGHLGLTVLRDLARDAGGELRVVSARGEGSRLTLEVPLR
ncbi:MAG: sensor histidine kinase [Thermoleophilaceae bacterium]